MSQPEISAKDLGTWSLICLQLHRFQRAYATDRAERQAVQPTTPRSELAIRSYRAQQVALEDE